MLNNPIQSNPINFESKMFVGLVVFLPLSQSCLDHGLQGFGYYEKEGERESLVDFSFIELSSLTACAGSQCPSLKSS
jgi:hypothetical protein